MDMLLLPPKESWFALENIDLKGVKSATVMAGWQAPPATALDFEMRLNSPDGKLVGQGSMPKPAAEQQGGAIPIKMNTTVNEKVDEIYFVYKPKEGENRGEAPVALMNVRFDGR
jgi:hypothetical protein